MDAGIRHGCSTWRAEGSPLAVEYSLSVFEQIRSAALDGLRAFRRGGVEIGGVLVGDRKGDTISVRDHLPLECEHAYGPSFRLSRNDETALAAVLSRLLSEPRIAGLQPVGWYLSHTRTDVRLRQADLDTWGRLFPGSGGILLIVRPDNTGTARAQFYYRDENGSARTDLTAEFSLQPYITGIDVSGAAPSAAPYSEGHGPAAPPRTVVIIESLPAVPELPEPRPENPVLDLRVWRRRWLVPVVAGLLGATLTGGAVYFH